MARIEPQGLLKTQHGFIAALLLDEHVAHALPKFGIIGLEHHTPIIRLQGLVQPPQLLQCIAEAQKVFGLRVQPDCTGDPLNGVVILLLLKGNDAHQMQRVGVVRLQGQSLPTTAFSFGDLPRL